MPTTNEPNPYRTWTRDQYFISMDPSLVPIPRLIELFDSADFYWAKPLPAGEMETMVQNSMVFSLFGSGATPVQDRTQTKSQSNGSNAEAGTSPPRFIGFARLVGDRVTFAYLTDVWVDAAYRGQGLGKWLVLCLDELLVEMRWLRRSLLFTTDSVPFYERVMGMQVIECKRGQGMHVMQKLGRGHPTWKDDEACQDRSGSDR